MAKLSKAESKLHQEALTLVEYNRALNDEEKLFVLHNYRSDAQHIANLNAAFFTPPEIAKELVIECIDKPKKRVLDLCAGIGMLGYFIERQNQIWSTEADLDLVCIEFNPDYVKAGKKILPNATWIQADAFYENIYKNLGYFDEVVSNPPYGIFFKNGWLHKFPSQFAAAEVAMKVSNRGVFILSQSDLPFMFSGCQGFKTVKNNKYKKFSEKTGIVFEMNCGIDLSLYEKNWKGLGNMKTEIVLISKKEN